MDGTVATTREQNARHYPILDALRFVLAFWVVMSHFGVFPLFAGADTSGLMLRGLSRVWDTSTYGIPAVIGFFIISGFCIHLPYSQNVKLLVGRYYARRYIRILIPVACALVISRLAGNHQPIFGQDTVLWSSVLWSLVCEEIYYAIYPAIRPVRQRFGWGPLLSITFSLSALTLALQYRAAVWGEFGPWKTALVMFPVWLLGCVLAEQSGQLVPLTSAAVIWTWRIGAWAASWICLVLNFHGHTPYTHTMLFFGVFAYFWIKKEIQYSLHQKPWGILTFGGAWSYSLYLLHYPAMDLFEKLHLPSMGPRLRWIVSYAAILAFSYLFYIAIERPSHALARKFKSITEAGNRLKEPEMSGRAWADQLVFSKLAQGGKDLAG